MAFLMVVVIAVAVVVCLATLAGVGITLLKVYKLIRRRRAK